MSRQQRMWTLLRLVMKVGLGAPGRTVTGRLPLARPGGESWHPVLLRGVLCHGHGKGRELDSPHRGRCAALLSPLVSGSPGTWPGRHWLLASRTCVALSGSTCLVSKTGSLARSPPGPLPPLALTGEGLGFRGCCNQVPQSAELPPTAVGSLPALEARGPKSRCPQGWFLREAPGEHPLQATLPASGGGQRSLAAWAGGCLARSPPLWSHSPLLCLKSPAASLS